MSREHVYRIELLDGSVQEMTARQVASSMGLDLARVRRRLQKRRVRTEAELREPVEEVMERSRRTFLRGTTAHFMEEKRRRAAEAARMEEIEEGHAPV